MHYQNFILLFLLLFLAEPFAQNGRGKTPDNKLTPISGINIFNNQDLEDFVQKYNIDGMGTEPSPYLIQNFYIQTNSYQQHAIHIESSSNFVIKDNLIEAKGEESVSIYLIDVTNLNIEENLIQNSQLGIYLFPGSTQVTIQRNIIRMNIDGGRIWGDDTFLITENVFENNSDKGLTVNDQNATVFKNNFINNGNGKQVFGTLQNWSNGSLGNYYSDYDGEDSDGNGVGDNPYYLDTQSDLNYTFHDPYPSFQPFDLELDTIYNLNELEIDPPISPPFSYLTFLSFLLIFIIKAFTSKKKVF